MPGISGKMACRIGTLLPVLQVQNDSVSVNTQRCGTFKYIVRQSFHEIIRFLGPKTPLLSLLAFHFPFPRSYIVCVNVR